MRYKVTATFPRGTRAPIIVIHDSHAAADGAAAAFGLMDAERVTVVEERDLITVELDELTADALCSLLYTGICYGTNEGGDTAAADALGELRAKLSAYGANCNAFDSVSHPKSGWLMLKRP